MARPPFEQLHHVGTRMVLPSQFTTATTPARGEKLEYGSNLTSEQDQFIIGLYPTRDTWRLAL